MTSLLPVGGTAPDFEGRAQDGSTVRMKDLRGHWVVLYFYPKDRTYNCTREACGFRNEYSEFQAEGAVVLGVSRDDLASHEDFSHRHRIPFPLIPDPTGTIVSEYGASRFYGWARRVSYLIDPGGRIAKVYPLVRARRHAHQVLGDLRKLKAAAALVRTP